MQDVNEPTPPAGWQPCSPMLLRSGVDCCTAPRWSVGMCGPHWHPPVDLAQPADPHEAERVIWWKEYMRTSLKTVYEGIGTEGADDQVDREIRFAERLAPVPPAIDPKLLHYAPGLYVVRHIDYWDGEGDIRWSFANLDAHGKWTHDEGGKPLIEYERDEILQVIPLDAPVMADSKVIGVTREWLEEWEEELRHAVMDGGKMHSQLTQLLGLHPLPDED